MATTAHRGGDAAAPLEAPPRVGAKASLTGLAATAARSARDLVGHTLEIALLESRLAGTALATMAGLGFAALVLVLSVWGLLLAAAAYGLMLSGLGPARAMLLLALINLIAAGVLVFVLLRLTKRLNFSATRRALREMGSGSHK
ncbi:MAG TPA: phage holin family protein [Burkholderiales bacterium]